MQYRTEICDAFELVWTDMRTFIYTLSEENFKAKITADRWSIAEEFYHILKSNAALCSAMKTVAAAYQRKFGKPEHTLRSYAECKMVYYQKIKKGGVLAPASLQYQEGQTLEREALLSHWEITLQKFKSRIMNWSEEELEYTLLPHPLLGKILVKEFLYFTHFHSLHHFESMKLKHSSLMQ